MAITALSQQIEGQQWKLSSKHLHDISYDEYIKSEQGTLILSDMPDRGYRRLTLSGAIAAKTMYQRVASVFRAFYDPSVVNSLKVGVAYSGDPLCHFDFSDEDIRHGKKTIEYQIVVTDESDMYFSLYCRDCESANGRRYVFSQPDDLYAFAMELGIKEAVIRNAEGKKLNTVSIDSIINPVSNLGSMLIIFNAAQDPDFKA